MDKMDNENNGLNEGDVLSDQASSSLKGDTTYIKDSNQLIQIDIECLDKVFPIQIEMLNQLTPRFNQSFMSGIEGYKVAGGMFGGTTHYKLNLRFDEAQGPLLMVTQTGKTQKMVDPLLDFFYEKGTDWEKPRKTDRTAKITKGQCIFFNYQKQDNAPLFAICMEDFQNQGFDHRTFGQVRGYQENLDIFKYRIRNISAAADRKIVQRNIAYMGNDVKEKINDQIKLVVRLAQLEQERKEVALSSARDSHSEAEKDQLVTKLAIAESQLEKVEKKHKDELDSKTAEISQLQQNLESESGSKAELVNKIKSKDNEIQEIGEMGKKEIQQKVQDHMQLKMENAKLKQKADATEDDLQIVKKEKEQLQQSIVKEAQEKQAQMDTIKQKETKIGSLEQELTAVKQTNQQLQSETTSAASTAVSASAGLQQQMTQQAEAHASALAAEKEKFAQLQAQAGNVNQEKEALAMQLKQLQETVQQAEEKRLQESKMVGEQAEGRTKELEAALQQKDAKLMQLVSSTADMEQAVKDSNDQLNKYKQLLEDSQGQGQALKSSVETSNKQLAEVTNQSQVTKQEYEQRIKQLEQGNQDLKTAATKGESRIAELESKDTAQQQMIVKLQDLIDQMNSQTEGTQQTEGDEDK